MAPRFGPNIQNYAEWQACMFVTGSKEPQYMPAVIPPHDEHQADSDLHVIAGLPLNPILSRSTVKADHVPTVASKESFQNHTNLVVKGDLKRFMEIKGRILADVIRDIPGHNLSRDRHDLVIPQPDSAFTLRPECRSSWGLTFRPATLPPIIKTTQEFGSVLESTFLAPLDYLVRSIKVDRILREVGEVTPDEEWDTVRHDRLNEEANNRSHRFMRLTRFPDPEVVAWEYQAIQKAGGGSPILVVGLPPSIYNAKRMEEFSATREFEDMPTKTPTERYDEARIQNTVAYCLHRSISRIIFTNGSTFAFAVLDSSNGAIDPDRLVMYPMSYKSFECRRAQRRGFGQIDFTRSATWPTKVQQIANAALHGLPPTSASASVLQVGVAMILEGIEFAGSQWYWPPVGAVPITAQRTRFTTRGEEVPEGCFGFRPLTRPSPLLPPVNRQTRRTKWIGTKEYITFTVGQYGEQILDDMPSRYANQEEVDEDVLMEDEEQMLAELPVVPSYFTRSNWVPPATTTSVPSTSAAPVASNAEIFGHVRLDHGAENGEDVQMADAVQVKLEPLDDDDAIGDNNGPTEAGRDANGGEQAASVGSTTSESDGPHRPVVVAETGTPMAVDAETPNSVQSTSAAPKRAREEAEVEELEGPSVKKRRSDVQRRVAPISTHCQRAKAARTERATIAVPMPQTQLNQTEPECQRRSSRLRMQRDAELQKAEERLAHVTELARQQRREIAKEKAKKARLILPLTAKAQPADETARANVRKRALNKAVQASAAVGSANSKASRAKSAPIPNQNTLGTTPQARVTTSVKRRRDDEVEVDAEEPPASRHKARTAPPAIAGPSRPLKRKATEATANNNAVMEGPRVHKRVRTTRSGVAAEDEAQDLPSAIEGPVAVRVKRSKRAVDVPIKTADHPAVPKKGRKGAEAGARRAVKPRT